MPRPPRAAAALTAGGAVLAACLAAAGCSAPAPAMSAAPALHPPAAAPGTAATAAPAPAGLTALSPAPAQAIIYTATLSVRTPDVASAAALAARLAFAAGGYVAAESIRRDRAGPGQASASVEVKIPVPAYRATLGALSSRLGTLVSQSQHAQNVTQVVADVTSRVASAQAAIAQLRRLLSRAGTVSGLLQVQEQLSTEESDLEALQSQQRALARETTYATVSLFLTGAPRAQPPRPAGGFTGGLRAGWHALQAVTAWLVTGAGLVLPFMLPLALLAAILLWSRRWLARRRAGAGTH